MKEGHEAEPGHSDSGGTFARAFHSVFHPSDAELQEVQKAKILPSFYTDNFLNSQSLSTLKAIEFSLWLMSSIESRYSLARKIGLVCWHNYIFIFVALLS